MTESLRSSNFFVGIVPGESVHEVVQALKQQTMFGVTVDPELHPCSYEGDGTPINCVHCQVALPNECDPNTATQIFRKLGSFLRRAVPSVKNTYARRGFGKWSSLPTPV